MKPLTEARREQLRRAGTKGARHRYILYGNPGTPEGRSNGGRRSTGRVRPIQKPAHSTLLAEFMGIIAGDGHLARYQVLMTTNSTTDIEHAHFVGDLGMWLFGVRPKISSRKTRKAMTVVFSSKAMVDFLQSEGLVIGNKIQQHLRVPPWIMNEPRYQIAFMRGVFDTDGGIFLDKHRIKHKIYAHLGWQFTSAIPEFRSDIVTILRQNGYRFSYSSKRVNIQMRRAADIAKYFDEVGTDNPKHINRFHGLR